MRELRVGNPDRLRDRRRPGDRRGGAARSIERHIERDARRGPAASTQLRAAGEAPAHGTFVRADADRDRQHRRAAARGVRPGAACAALPRASELDALLDADQRHRLRPDLRPAHAASTRPSRSVAAQCAGRQHLRQPQHDRRGGRRAAVRRRGPVGHRAQGRRPALPAAPAGAASRRRRAARGAAVQRRRGGAAARRGRTRAPPAIARRCTRCATGRGAQGRGARWPPARALRRACAGRALAHAARPHRRSAISTRCCRATPCCAWPTDDGDRLVQLAAVLAVGSRARLAGRARERAGRAPARRGARAHRAGAGLDAAARCTSMPCCTMATPRRCARCCRRWPTRAGPIVGVVAPARRAMHGVPLERLVVERALSVNTAAAGGNASLMTIG